MDLKEMIKVMQHYDNGGKVEHRLLSATVWHLIDCPYWDWTTFAYRIAQSTIAADGHNPDKVTVEQLEPHLGWRLLKQAEIKERYNPALGLELWLGYKWTASKYVYGSDITSTYRTKLTPAELAKYDCKAKQPLTAADFPPGTVIRWKTQDKRSWTSIVAVTPHEIRLGNGNTISYSASLSIHSILDDNNLEYSTDQGKTWLPCYKEV